RRELRRSAERAGVGLLDEILRVRRIPCEVARQVVEGVGVGERLAPERDSICRILGIAHAPTILPVLRPGPASSCPLFRAQRTTRRFVPWPRGQTADGTPATLPRCGRQRRPSRGAPATKGEEA